MRRCLLFISLALLLCLEAAGQEYNLLMQVRGRELTGVCVMDSRPDGSIMGTVVSEFGMKAFDFTYVKGKTKVLNVVTFLDKWYIRSVLRRDLAFILSNLPQGKDAQYKRRSMTFSPDGRIDVVNGKFNIRYTFTPMTSEQ